ncbi:MAG: restriction endonuclease subunit S, partial [Bacteroidota bacterium]
EGGEPGRAAIWTRDEPFAYQKALHRARPRGGIEAAYLLYMLEDAAGSGRLAEHFTGSTINHLTGRELAKVRVPLAPLAEQRRIVDALEAHLADLDAGVAALKAARRDLDRYRRSVLQAAVTGALTADWRARHPEAEDAASVLERILEERRAQWEADQLATYETKGKTPPKTWRDRYKEPAAPEADGLPDLPPRWVWASFSALFDHRLGKMLDKRKNTGTLRPYLRNVNVRWHGFDLDDVLEMRIEDDELHKYTVRKGDLVICEGGEPGRGAIWKKEEPFAYQKALHRARPYSDVDAEFVLLYLEYAASSERLRRHFTGSTISHLTGRALAEVAIPLPSPDEQAAITEAVDERLSVAEAIAAEIDCQLARAARLRRALLQRAFAGRLVPQDPADEPASVLLARLGGEVVPEAASGPEAGRQGMLDFG